jgi:O-antigen/teichoic acid export membrane protein
MPPGAPRSLFSRAWHAFDGLAGDTLWSGAHDFLNLVTAFTSFQLLQRALELEQYGAYIGLYGLVGAFGAISMSGVGLALLQRIMGARDDPDSSLRSFLSLSIFVGLVSVVVVSVVGVASLRLSFTEIALIALAELLAVAIVWMGAISVQASSGYPASARVRMGIIAIRLVTLLVLQFSGNLTIANLGAGFLIGFTLYAAYLVVFHLPRHGYHVSLGRPSTLSMKSSGLFSIPMGASKMQTDGDKWLLNVFRFDAEAGLYGAAYRVVQLGTLPLLALDSAAFQRFLPQGTGEPGLHWRRAVRLATIMTVASVTLAGLLYAALPLLDFLFTEDYKEAVDIVPWLLMLIPLIAVSSTPLNGLLGLGHADKRMYVYLSSAMVSIVIYLALIPRYSWKGALVGTFVSEIYLVATGWIVLWHYQRKADETAEAGETDPAMTPA